MPGCCKITPKHWFVKRRQKWKGGSRNEECGKRKDKSIWQRTERSDFTLGYPAIRFSALQNLIPGVRPGLYFSTIRIPNSEFFRMLRGLYLFPTSAFQIPISSICSMGFAFFRLPHSAFRILLYAPCTMRLFPATYNPQHPTRNPQPATRNSQLATRNSQLATRNPQPATNHSYQENVTCASVSPNASLDNSKTPLAVFFFRAS